MCNLPVLDLNLSPSLLSWFMSFMVVLIIEARSSLSSSSLDSSLTTFFFLGLYSTLRARFLLSVEDVVRMSIKLIELMCSDSSKGIHRFHPLKVLLAEKHGNHLILRS